MKVSVLIDSHGWIEYFAEGPLAQKYAKYVESANSSEYVTPATVLYEVYKKIKSSKGEELALQVVSFIIKNTAIISVDKETAINAAEISIRTKLSMADALIKAVAEYSDAKIITGDEHFKGLENVVFIS